MTDAEIERALAAFGGDHLPVKAAGERWIRTRAFPLARLALDRGKEIERLRELVKDVHACLSDLFCECEDLASEAEDNPLVDLILRSRALLGGGNDAE